MGLTPEQMKALEMPFSLNEHDYNGSNQPYLRKPAIRRRLRQIDPNFQMGDPVLVSADEELIVMKGSLTVLGVTVWGLGTGRITRIKRDGTEITGSKLTGERSKAYKAAASDILPRAALELNLGAYLRGAPEKPGFSEWLEKLAGPKHWSANGGRDRAQDMLKELGMKWVDVNTLIEPGKTLNRLDEVTLSEAQFYLRLIDLRQPAQPKTADASH